MKELWFLACITVVVWLAALGVPDPIVLDEPLDLKLALVFLGLIPALLPGRSGDPWPRHCRRRYGWW